MRVIIDFNALIFPITSPWINRNISNGIAFACNIGIIFQLTIQYIIDALGFIGVTINGVFNFLRCVESEVVVLPKHGAKATHLEHQPLQHLVLTAGALG